jgi:hypothetical protein
MKKLLILFFVVMLFPCTAFSETIIKGDFEYSVKSDDTAIIEKYSGYGYNLIIPDAIDGHRVTEIGKEAFSKNEYIHTVMIPEGVMVIGESAFQSCKNLKSVKLPSSLQIIDNLVFGGCALSSVEIPDACKVIGNDAFYSCDLYSVTIPEGVESIGDNAFGSNYFSSIVLPASVDSIGINPFSCCESLTSIFVSAKNPKYATIDGVLFEKSTKKLVSYPVDSSRSSYEIPSGIQIIGAYSFEKCSYLDLTIPLSVTTIEDEAFGNSKISLTIPESVINIGANPFVGYDFPSHISVSENHPFLVMKKVGFSEILYDENEKKIISFGDDFPEDALIIGKKAFASNFFTSMTIPNTIIRIEDKAFSFCPFAESITVPESVSFIGENAFENCFNLTVYVYKDSYAASYCLDHDIPFSYINREYDWL